VLLRGFNRHRGVQDLICEKGQMRWRAPARLPGSRFLTPSIPHRRRDGERIRSSGPKFRVMCPLPVVSSIR